MKKKLKKEKKEILNFILILIGSVIILYFIIRGIIKNTSLMQKCLFTLQNLSLLASLILNSIVQLSPKKKILKIISKSLFLFSLTLFFAILEIGIIRDKIGVFFLLLISIVGILEIIFDSIHYKKTSNNLFLSYLTLETIFSLKILSSTDINTFYLLLISYISLLVGGMITQFGKIRIKKTIWIIIEIVSLSIINHYIITYVF